MSGVVHQSPFRHYHRNEDGTTYFVFNGDIHSAPTMSAQEHGPSACLFDVDGSALAIKDWHAPSEFYPIQREVEEALGLPLTRNAFEKVRDAINAMESEWKSDYDYPDFLSVYPKGDTTDDGIAWSWGIDQDRWVGNDRMQQNSESLCIATNSKPEFVAGLIVTFMRKTAIKRVQWLNDFAEKCVKHIEASTQHHKEGWAIVNTWRQR